MIEKGIGKYVYDVVYLTFLLYSLIYLNQYHYYFLSVVTYYKLFIICLSKLSNYIIMYC